MEYFNFQTFAIPSTPRNYIKSYASYSYVYSNSQLRKILIHSTSMPEIKPRKSEISVLLFLPYEFNSKQLSLYGQISLNGALMKSEDVELKGFYEIKTLKGNQFHLILKNIWNYPVLLNEDKTLAEFKISTDTRHRFKILGSRGVVYQPRIQATVPLKLLKPK